MKKLKIILQSNVFYLFLFLFLSGYVVFFTCIKQYKTQYSSNTKEIVGILSSFTMDGDKLSMIIKANEKISATYYIQSSDEKNTLENTLKEGITLKLVGSQKEVVGMTIPNTFDYKKYLYHQHIYFSFTATKLEIQNEHLGIFYTIKNKVNARVQKLGNDAYLRAIVLGDKTLIDYEQYENIMQNGVSHLFALSGMHLSFLYVFLNKVLGKIKWKKLLIYSILFLYLFLTGCSISFFRAILFLLLLDFNKKYGFTISKIKVLFLTASISLILNPFYIFQVGFWYTFVVTFSLIFCSESINKQRKLFQIVWVSVVTFFFSLPISIFINYEVNLFSILNNVVLVPFISTLVFPFALLSFCFSFFLPIFKVLVIALESMNAFFATFSLPIVFGKITILEILMYYGLLILAIKLRSKKLFVILFFFLLLLYNKNLFNKDYNVYFLDVGQGDAAVIVSPQNKGAIMVDTGGIMTSPKEDFQKRNKEFHLSDNIILFLKSIRVRKIDTLLLSHGDYDHMGEATHLVHHFKVKEVIFNHDEYNDLELKLIEILKQKQIPYFKDKKELNFANNPFYFLNGKLYDNENDNSLVFYIELNGIKFLFMGDAGTVVEKDILKKYNLKDMDVLKVGHHGSKTSSSEEFIETITPKYSIISVGRNNRYGHPNKEALDHLKNSIVYRTDLQGSIRFIIKDNKFEIETCSS